MLAERSSDACSTSGPCGTGGRPVKTSDIIAAIRAQGNNASDLQDAAHEAHHALDAGVPEGQWDRTTIHRYVADLGPDAATASEVMARAVEQIVCADMGVDCGPPESWAIMSCLEAAKLGMPLPSVDAFLARVREAMVSPEARAAADRVMALALA